METTQTQKATKNAKTLSQANQTCIEAMQQIHTALRKNTDKLPFSDIAEIEEPEHKSHGEIYIQAPFLKTHSNGSTTEIGGISIQTSRGGNNARPAITLHVDGQRAIVDRHLKIDASPDIIELTMYYALEELNRKLEEGQ